MTLKTYSKFRDIVTRKKNINGGVAERNAKLDLYATSSLSLDQRCSFWTRTVFQKDEEVGSHDPTGCGSLCWVTDHVT